MPASVPPADRLPRDLGTSPVREDGGARYRIRSVEVIQEEALIPPAPALKARRRVTARFSALTHWAFAWTDLSTWEMLAVALLLALAVGGQVLAAGAGYLFQRNLWLDEIYTHTLVSDPDWGHALEALAGGVETHPPTLYALLRLYTALWGGSSEVALRSFALLAVVLALVGLYAGLRAAFAPAASLAGVLAVWCHGLVVHHAFEARFYGPWLAATAWFAYLLARSRVGKSRTRMNLARAASAVLLCVIHYFGIITLALVVGLEAIASPSLLKNRRGSLLAAAAGPAALGLCLPLLVRQRAAFSVPTWVQSPTVADVAQLGTWILLPASLTAVLILAWLSAFSRRIRGVSDEAPGPGGDFTRVAGLTGLLLLPLVLVALSFTVQPVLVDRYALPAVAGLAPAVAYLASRMGRAWVVALVAFLTVVGTQQLGNQAAEARDRDRRTAETIAAIRRHRGGDPVLCEDIVSQYALHRYAPELRSDCLFLDHERNEFAGVGNDYFFCRDLARRYAAFYREPRLLSWDAFRKTPRRYLLVVGVPWSNSRQTAFRRDYPGFITRPVSPGVYELLPLGLVGAG